MSQYHMTGHGFNRIMGAAHYTHNHYNNSLHGFYCLATLCCIHWLSEISGME